MSRFLLSQQVYKPNSVPQRVEVIYLDIMLPLCLKRHSPMYIGARTCTGWGLPLLHVAMQEMQVILQLFTFSRHHAAPGSIVSVALSLYCEQFLELDPPVGGIEHKMLQYDGRYPSPTSPT